MLKQIPLPDFPHYSEEEMRQRATAFHVELARRRSVRDFADTPVEREVIEQCLATAGTAPSGANLQPWHFVAVSSPEVKEKIRVGAEHEEEEFYTHRATPEWLQALEPLGTDASKPLLEVAPWLIGVFLQRWGTDEEGASRKHYYAHESVGIATGMLITALHNAGLACLTHTPSPMGFLNELLQRPENERPYLLLVVGYPAEDATVPAIERKSLDEITTFV
ncbi:MAG: nitroreductase family protein [Gemmatimonadetes bacterium]|jgi:iodotyrosine deiodinase|nr:nitroreductase family protein [Gemmatimonadota bacterium]MBT5964636.1 nitroreductase family protein [Gemmatimonadota bacterium]MBT7455928.1 nitroreductase family protein [Gemmatimonadota bacterium]